MADTVTILGINGRIGQFAAKAFIEAGWNVVGFGRSNKTAFDGFTFVQGDAIQLEDVKRAIKDADVVVHALNLPYDQWEGEAERLNDVVIEAMKGTGKTLVFSANVYNFAASVAKMTPDGVQNPETPKGEIRKRMEEALKAGALNHGFKAFMLRAGDFYGPGAEGSWFDLGFAMNFKKRKITLPCDGQTKHTWAYLPDLGRAFEKVAAKRDELNTFENLHFHGNFVTGNEIADAIQRVVPQPYKVVNLPWWLFSVVGVFQPVIREVIKMRYLWKSPQELLDPKLDAILGAGFGTPFERAVAETTLALLPAAELEKLKTMKRTSVLA
ncbi:NAD-dependent epimerase/dehydratase family protein [uncultured Maritalea sp.]|uniref:NAD-dependent epimerase/dehydratase family protein n=1 Tax=uncultured Maritalea sp. TaxID=757249 RepID=UPI0026336D0E|nr:NAD-dependent epimerase/dehydratase family protein [uncultured Maritalea sp.]